MALFNGSDIDKVVPQIWTAQESEPRFTELWVDQKRSRGGDGRSGRNQRKIEEKGSG